MDKTSENIRQITQRLLGRFAEHDARRIAMTVSCLDSNDIPKVHNAGQIETHQGSEVQVMHNGTLVKKGGYHGEWMAEIIQRLNGHHEPQEEALFDWAMKSVKNASPVFVELGAFWSYYACWFLRQHENGRAVTIEPDPNNYEVGQFNLKLNSVEDRTVCLRGSCGAEDRPPEPFVCESDFQERMISQRCVPSIMAEADVEFIDVLLMDIQGAELNTLIGMQDLLKNNKIGCLFVSTHHYSISGSPHTHIACLNIIKNCGGHIVVEHDVHESFSGDGLIVASFGDFPQDYNGPLTYNRLCNSLFPTLLPEA